jgi:hypothetical protein
MQYLLFPGLKVSSPCVHLGDVSIFGLARECSAARVGGPLRPIYGRPKMRRRTGSTMHCAMYGLTYNGRTVWRRNRCKCKSLSYGPALYCFGKGLKYGKIGQRSCSLEFLNWVIYGLYTQFLTKRKKLNHRYLNYKNALHMAEHFDSLKNEFST